MTQPENSTELSPVQHQALSLLAQGMNVAAVARACNLHRTTIHNWKRICPDFSDALRDLRSETADHWRIEIQQHAEACLAAVRALVDDPKTPASVRLKAALHVLTVAAAPPPPQTKVERQHDDDMRVLLFRKANPDYRTPTEEMLSQIQADEQARRDLFRESLTAVQTANSSQFITSSAAPSPGRNTKCPCGSNRKFKQCCLTAA